MPEDRALLDDALERVCVLNDAYAADGPDLRPLPPPSVMEPGRKLLDGLGGKRGKLSEFNRLLRGDHGTTYMVSSSDPAAETRTRFVITLDADTQMLATRFAGSWARWPFRSTSPGSMPAAAGWSRGMACSSPESAST